MSTAAAIPLLLASAINIMRLATSAMVATTCRIIIVPQKKTVVGRAIDNNVLVCPA